VRIEAELQELGLVLPEPMRVPPDLRMPFSWVRVRGNRAYVSGHITLNTDGSVAEPLGKVGAEVSAEEGYESARLAWIIHEPLPDLVPKAPATAAAPGAPRRGAGEPW
jgi:hypothetical protein